MQKPFLLVPALLGLAFTTMSITCGTVTPAGPPPPAPVSTYVDLESNNYNCYTGYPSSLVQNGKMALQVSVGSLSPVPFSQTNTLNSTTYPNLTTLNLYYGTQSYTSNYHKFSGNYCYFEVPERDDYSMNFGLSQRPGPDCPGTGRQEVIYLPLLNRSYLTIPISICHGWTKYWVMASGTLPGNNQSGQPPLYLHIDNPQDIVCF